MRLWMVLNLFFVFAGSIRAHRESLRTFLWLRRGLNRWLPTFVGTQRLPCSMVRSLLSSAHFSQEKADGIRPFIQFLLLETMDM